MPLTFSSLAAVTTTSAINSREFMPFKEVSVLRTEDITNIRNTIQSIINLSFSFLGIAGGAPRDLYFNMHNLEHSKIVKDFDIYFNSVLPLSYIYIGLFTEANFDEVVELSSADYEDNNGNGPDKVFRIIDKGYEYNIIIYCYEENIDNIVKNFSCSLSKFILDIENNKIVADKEALMSIASNTLIFKDSTPERYKRKIKRYFPSYTVGNFKDAAIKIIDKEINKLPSKVELG